MNKILIIEDSIDINNLLKEILVKNEYEVVQAFTGADGFSRLNEDFDLILLDLMMPIMDGETFINKMREDNYKTPIIVITAKIDKETRYSVLDLGADDFITKPFDEKDVIYRIRANIRRYREFSDGKSIENSNVIEHKNLKLFQDENRITIKNNELKATPIEFNIIKTLLLNPNKIFSKENLYKAVWQDEYFYEADTINVHMSNLRSKLKKLDNEEYIETVWAMGYRLKK